MGFFRVYGEKMSYDKADLEKKALAAIKRHKIKFVSHLTGFLPCNRATFYNLELDKLDTIKDAIEEMRMSAKVKTLNRWEKSENATLQVAYMKLIADDDEADRLNGSNQKINHSGAVGNYTMSQEEWEAQAAKRLQSAAKQLEKFNE